MTTSRDQIELVGTLYRTPAKGRPVVYLDEASARLLQSWKDAQEIFTNWNVGLHPDSGHESPKLYPSERMIGSLQHGDMATFTLQLRPDRKKGRGIKFLSVQPL